MLAAAELLSTNHRRRPVYWQCQPLAGCDSFAQEVLLMRLCLDSDHTEAGHKEELQDGMK